MSSDDLKKIFDESIGSTKIIFYKQSSTEVSEIGQEGYRNMVQVSRSGSDKHHGKGD
jgi:hypothetical protein